MAGIISISRRTDIAAFYPEWLMERLRAGYVRWPSPYGGKPCEVSLLHDDVSAAVFWSKNYAPLLPHLHTIDQRGWGLLFHYTITGLPRVFEPGVPDAERSVATFRALSERYGAAATLWRYDPILISSITDAEYHLARFEAIASALEGLTERCHISFAQSYAKVRRNSAALTAATEVTFNDPESEEKVELAHRLASIAREHGISMYSCCGDYLVGGQILKAHCVDGELLHRLYPGKIRSARGNPTRKECGCSDSRDIGVYDTCPHGCFYCYANASKAVADARHRSHDPRTDMLTGDSGLGEFHRAPEQPTLWGRASEAGR